MRAINVIEAHNLHNSSYTSTSLLSRNIVHTAQSLCSRSITSSFEKQKVQLNKAIMSVIRKRFDELGKVDEFEQDVGIGKDMATSYQEYDRGAAESNDYCTL